GGVLRAGPGRGSGRGRERRLRGARRAAGRGAGGDRPGRAGRAVHPGGHAVGDRDRVVRHAGAAGDAGSQGTAQGGGGRVSSESAAGKAGLQDRLVSWGYGAAWTIVKLLPERTAYRLFDVIADRLWARRGGQVRQLEKNLLRVLGKDTSEKQLREGSQKARSSALRQDW